MRLCPHKNELTRVSELERPVFVAHRAGNRRSSLRAATDAGVDYVEADLWWWRGRIVARHEKAVWRSPILYDKWKLGIADRPALCLPEICAATKPGPGLLLDLKGSRCALVPAIVKTLRDQAAVGRAAICGQNWRLLDTAYELEPRLSAFYSLETPRQLGELHQRPVQGPPVRAVSVWEGMLTPQLIAEFHEREIAIYAWTVNRIERARELVALGVSGIISDRQELLQSLRQPAAADGAGVAGSSLPS